MKNLKDIIWETRKTRIITEERLLRMARFFEYIIPYYSISLIAITIFPKTINQALLNYASVIGSVFIIVFSIILSNQKYYQRSYEIKTQYIELQRLLFQFDNQIIDINKIESLYLDLLTKTENHTDFDYLKLKVKMKKNRDSTVEKPTKLECFTYYLRLISCYILFLFAYSIPIIFIIYILI